MVEESVRTSCGALRASDAGRAVELCGWINRRRDHGGLIFADLRDTDGLTQIVFDPQRAHFADAEHLRHEDVVRIRGGVRRRPEGTEIRASPPGTLKSPSRNSISSTDRRYRPSR